MIGIKNDLSIRHIIRCKEHGLKQFVQEPTRGPNLLDLALSSLHGAAAATVVPGIADRNGVLVTVKLPSPKVHVIQRTVWDYGKADWKGLNVALQKLDYDIPNCSDIDIATASFVEQVVSEAKRYIPTRTLRECKGTHPWLNDVCREAIMYKQSRFGSEEYKDACEACTRVLRQAHEEYIMKMREELRHLPKGSKRWWSLSKMLLDNAPSKSGIPSLKNAEDKWIHDGRGKADLLANSFASKFVLPDPVEESVDDIAAPSAMMSDFVLVRERWVRRELLSLRANQATGMDELPARILRECGRTLARPVTVLIRKMLQMGRWPEIWRSHRVCPLYKKGVVYKPSNYRGLHITPVRSKVAERVIKIPLSNFLEATDGYGSSQWAFRKQRGCTDLVLLLVCSWLNAFQRRHKVGVFLSDIASAFDRVDSAKLLAKMRRLGICKKILVFFEDYLAPRSARVAVDGEVSDIFILQNMVFQGTVFGPSLWNIFFADVHEPAQRNGATEGRFADDLSISKEFFRNTSNEDIVSDMRQSQSDIHEWGRRNRVSFDPSKESFAILATSDGNAEPFRLLGPTLDEKLLMHECIEKLYRKAKPKARALLRYRRFYSIGDMILLFKAHVRSQIEWCNGAIFHAAPSKLDYLDSVQKSFLRHLGIDEKRAYIEFNLAPLKLRRDIGMLGVLFKICRGAAHVDFNMLFPRAPNGPKHEHSTRATMRRHDMQLVDFCDGTQLCQFQRSLFGLVKVWNALPASYVHAKCVSTFQTMLTQASKQACSVGICGWQDMFATSSLPHTLLVRFCFCFG